MRRADLVLWMLIYPWATVFAGLLAGLVSYLLTMPRNVDPERGGQSRGHLAVESWRILAILAGIPAFFLGAELMLWGRQLSFRAPVIATGLPYALGLWLLCLAPLPPLAAWTRFEPPAGRPLLLAAVLALLGLAGTSLGPWAAARSWEATVEAAAEDPAALRQLIQLKAHRYVPPEASAAALDRLLPAPEQVLDLVDAEAERFDGDLRRYAADRIERALVDARLEDPERAVPAIWALTGDDARSLRAYALTRPALRARALEGAEALDPREVGLLALAETRGPLRLALMEALHPSLDGRALGPELVAALAEVLDEPEPRAGLALSILLRDGSRAALRPALPRFVDARGQRLGYDGPVWEILRRDCMVRTAGLSALREDEDPAVAAGADEVFKYVRQYCGKRWRQG